MLIIARHGRTAANAAGELLGRRDPSLDDRGARQARAVADAVGAVTRVVSSPLRRCTETAAAISADVDVDHRFVELDYGSLEGERGADLAPEIWAAWRADPDWRPPGGETLVEMAERVAAALDALRAEAAERDIVVVTHVSPIKAALAWTLGVGIEISWRAFVPQASITRIGFTDSRPSLRSFGEVTHLDGDGGARP